MLTRFKSSKPPDVVRARMALPTAFSQELDGLAQVILTKPVYVWKGMHASRMNKALDITYIGGGEQYYLPNLASDSLGLSSTVCYLHCSTSAELLI
ncbi:MAG TPA: hypothetical protein VFF50_13505 [Candidatus Deferrimicrobiaceae bacterium]|nr:hypothetical protein [Candidatus Deferrimicrobiaceae bacterium]